MQANNGPFSAADLCDALGASVRAERIKIRRQLVFFRQRGEIKLIDSKQVGRKLTNRYLYIRASCREPRNQAGAMRAWMQAQTGPFSAAALCDALGYPGWVNRTQLRRKLLNFQKRGEIILVRDKYTAHGSPNRYLYIRDSCPMPKKNPRTGLAKAMRVWMQGKKDSFNTVELYNAMAVSGYVNSDMIRRYLPDFQKRGEIMLVTYKRFGRQSEKRYLYIKYPFRVWKRKRNTPVKSKILKAIYIAGVFAASDLLRLLDLPSREFIVKIVRKLDNAGHIRKVGRRRCHHGHGIENLYQIVDRDRFRIEEMQ